MRTFHCPYLEGEVELTDEREKHIAETHPDLLPEYLPQIEKTLADPDEIRKSDRMDAAKTFCRWFDEIRDGKYIVTVVVSDVTTESTRHWIITSYISRRLSNGEVIWNKS